MLDLSKAQKSFTLIGKPQRYVFNGPTGRQLTLMFVQRVLSFKKGEMAGESFEEIRDGLLKSGFIGRGIDVFEVDGKKDPTLAKTLGEATEADKKSEATIVSGVRATGAAEAKKPK